MASSKDSKQPNSNSGSTARVTSDFVTIISKSSSVDELQSSIDGSLSYIRHGENQLHKSLLNEKIVKDRIASGRYLIKGS